MNTQSQTTYYYHRRMAEGLLPGSMSTSGVGASYQNDIVLSRSKALALKTFADPHSNADSSVKWQP